MSNRGFDVGLDNKKVVIRKSVHGFRLCNSWFAPG